MSVRSFVVVGEYADPDEFHDYLYDRLKKRQHLHLQAVERHNELANRRGNTPQQFEFIVKEIHRDANYLNVQDVESGAWIQVRVDDKIHFDIIE